MGVSRIEGLPDYEKVKVEFEQNSNPVVDTESVVSEVTPEESILPEEAPEDNI